MSVRVIFNLVNNRTPYVLWRVDDSYELQITYEQLLCSESTTSSMRYLIYNNDDHKGTSVKN